MMSNVEFVLFLSGLVLAGIVGAFLGEHEEREIAAYRAARGYPPLRVFVEPPVNPIAPSMRQPTAVSIKPPTQEERASDFRRIRLAEPLR